MGYSEHSLFLAVIVLYFSGIIMTFYSVNIIMYGCYYVRAVARHWPGAQVVIIRLCFEKAGNYSNYTFIMQLNKSVIQHNSWACSTFYIDPFVTIQMPAYLYFHEIACYNDSFP